MGDQMIFRRYEYKYLLTRSQYVQLLQAMKSRMEPDAYSRSAIHNLYYDTPDFRLIRASLEQPLYKEKLRLRCYGNVDSTTPAFAELKKKFDSVVYKRRIRLPLAEAVSALAGASPLPEDPVGQEIGFALLRYPGLEPRVRLDYDRLAFRGREDPGFRVTFDENIRFRTEILDLTAGSWGTALLPPDTVLMELKMSDSIPLWMVRELSRLGIRKTSFSKYGTVYQNYILTKGNRKYA